MRRFDGLEALLPAVPAHRLPRRLLWLARPFRPFRPFRARRARRQQQTAPEERLCQALIKMGPAYVKLGQILSTRPDLIGDRAAQALTRLQDDLDFLPPQETQQRVEALLAQPLSSAFAQFDLTPFSAASLAQAHAAELPDGRSVVVKLLRPDAMRDFQADVESLVWAGRWIERLSPAIRRRFKPRALAEQLRAQALSELDMRLEAAAMGRLSDQFAERDDVAIPKVVWDLTRPGLLTMTRLDFIPIDEPDALRAAGHDLDQVLTRAAELFFASVFEHGYFHGDQHAGNMGVTPEGRIAFVDFGIMGFVNLEDRLFLADVMAALLARRYEAVAERYLAAGYLSTRVDPNAFAQAIRAVTEPIMDKPLAEISFGRLLGELLSMSQRFALEVEPALYLLQKNMLMAEGIARQLSPRLNIWQLAAPLMEQWMRQQQGPGARIERLVKAVLARIEAEIAL